MSTTRNTDTVEVIMRDQRRRRWSLAEKAALVRRSYEPGMGQFVVSPDNCLLIGAGLKLLFSASRQDAKKVSGKRLG